MQILLENDNFFENRLQVPLISTYTMIDISIEFYII